MARIEPEATSGTDSTPDRLAVWATQHLTLLAGGAFATLVALLLVRVSRGNPRTALAVLQQGGTGNILLGTSLALLPLVAAGLVGGILAHVWPHPAPQRTRRTTMDKVGLTAVILVVGVAIAPLVFVAMSVVMAVLLRRRSSESREGSGAAILLLGCVWFFLVAAPWWPLERVEPEGGGGSVVGYVLSASGDDLAVLTEDSRHVEYLSIAGPASRRICVDDSRVPSRLLTESIWSVVRDRDGYPEC